MPSFAARRNIEADDADPLERFGETMKIIARSTHTVGSDEDGSEVSTPLTRRADRAEIRMMARTAARRRRNVVLVLSGLTLVTGVLVPLTSLRWYAALVPGLALLAFLVVARFSVVRLNASLDAKLAALETDWHEDTISFEVPADLREDSSELSIEISAPIEGLGGSLWDPIPVTVPTYVSKPLVPRTVRTIDLSAPEPAAAPRTPVVAEAPQPEVVEGPVLDEDLGRAANE
ncbi:hypothetical protein [Luteococcus peritonei]|uniref:Uncharacterized protein n=1 Tax=Luteococcus peritonei TaxID=88874 RepID=A0ABW4RXJ2_9ACTN